MPFRKILIANRGEIACRIMRTLSAMGIASVAIHHRLEAAARHVTMADEALEITGETPVEAHLDIAQIVALARSVGADAIHPGYGFLSENAAFAAAVTAAGLTFIGPDARTIALMGDKVSAREFARANNVAVAPSVMASDDLGDFVTRASAIGFPLLIKAAAGGGGKGMSIVRSASDLEAAVRRASGEAERYFGDGRIYAETYVERPRHIEVQVLGDGEGNVIHLFERECSIQRRFQKIVEEAPAANLPGGLRDEICACAVTLATAARYKNAGTVEFILGGDGRFFFLEMNTRLQVEHPVTEMVTGMDLVRAQIEIAAGLGLPCSQADVPVDGHAIECRVCAEDPERDFLPETGTVRYLSVPRADWLRFESAIAPGHRVTADFDPMLAKLVVHAPDRAEAIDRSIAALDDLSVLGVTTNIDYLARVLGHGAFRDGALHTGFVPDHADALRRPEPGHDERDRLLIAGALGFREFREAAFGLPDLQAAMGGWTN